MLMFVLNYNIYFLLFNLIMWPDSRETTLFFNIFTLAMSYLNFFSFKVFLISHNDVIHQINKKFYKIKILSVEPNPLLMV